MMEAEIWTIVRTEEGATLLLKLIDDERGIPIFIDQSEIHPILLGYDKKVSPRPFIHDIFLDMAQQLGLALFRIEVHDIKNNIFHVRMLFSGLHYNKEKPLVLQGRPGDACALAVRSKCPIWVSPKVVEQVGVPADLFMRDWKNGGCLF